MKSSKEATRAARQLFRLSLVDGTLDMDRVKVIIRKLSDAKPRGYMATIAQYHRLLRLELEKRHAVIESAEALTPELVEQVTADMKRKYGEDLTTEFKVTPSLLGGMRLKLGSDVWDGSVKNRLERLSERIA
jgi:F-type H+-transporting ATPase subunit delta